MLSAYAGDSFVAALSVDAVHINNSDVGMFFAGAPHLGTAAFNFSNDGGGLAAGY